MTYRTAPCDHESRPYDPSKYTVDDILRSYLPICDPRHPANHQLTEGQIEKVRRKAGRVRAAMPGASITVRNK